MSWQCQRCGTENEAQDTVCSMCGASKPKEDVYEETAAENVVYECPSCGKKYTYEDFKNGYINCTCSEKVTLKSAKKLIAPKLDSKRLFIREIRAVMGEKDTERKSIRCYPTSVDPEYISEEIKIGDNYDFGRNDFPSPETYKYISEKHCTFFMDENGNWNIKGCRTTNGTYVNNSFLAEEQTRELKENDQLQFADKLFLVFIR